MENLNLVIANNLIKLRKKYNYTQADVASLIQYSDKTISKWETGEIIPSVENLIRLCEIYGVTLNQITSPISNEVLSPKPQKNLDRQNKFIITMLAILAVWIVATILFVYANIIGNINIWIVFIWALPISCIVGIVFASLWGNRTLRLVVISIMLWTLITSIYLTFLSYNIFAIYFIGIPLQIAIFLWSGLKKRQ